MNMKKELFTTILVISTSLVAATSSSFPRFTMITPQSGSAFRYDGNSVGVWVTNDVPVLFTTSRLDIAFNHPSASTGPIGWARQNDNASLTAIFVTIPEQRLPDNADLVIDFTFTDNVNERSISTTYYFDTFDPENPVIEAENFDGSGEPDAPVVTLESTDALREWIADERMIAGIDSGDILNYNYNFPEGNYHVYLKERLDHLQESLVSLQVVEEATATELGVFNGVNTDGFFRNFQLKNRAGNRAMVVPLNGPASLRLASETDDLNGDSLFLNYLVFVPTDDPVQSLFLQSSPNVEGPYVDDPAAVIDEETRTIETPRAADQQFYLIDGPPGTVRPTDIELTGDTVRIRFEP